MYKVDTEELRVSMARAGFSTIEALASAAGVNRNTTSGVISGKLRPSSDVMYKLADALKLDGLTAGRIFFA